MENIENMDEEVELGVDNDDLKISFHRDNGGDETHGETRRGNPIPDQERFLPIANVARVMKRMIPNSGKIAKDAKECVQECVSEFISFITSEANDKCLSEKRKTISADDLLEAIANMGFDNYVAPLQLFLERYRAAHKLNSIFPNSSIPRFSSASEGCSTTLDGANVARVMKRMIPNSGKIAKDAKECVQECVSEFISFITSEANDKCLSEKRKTISADDLLEAIANMGFDNYVAPLQLFLERYRAAHKLNSIFPNSSIPRFSSASEGCSTTLDGESSEPCTARDYPSQTIAGLNSTTSATTGGGHACHAYQSATTSHGTSELHSGQNNSSSNGAPIVLAGGIGGMPVTALQQQPMQIYIDPASKQHYMALETDQGMQLYPIQIQTDGPVAYTITSEAVTSMTSGSNENQAFIMVAAGDVEDNHINTVSSEPSSAMEATTSNGSSARSSTSNARSNNQNDFSIRHHAKNTSSSTTFAATVNAQSEEHMHSRSSTKRQPGVGKNNAGKVVAPTKRPRHS
ncbi:hypothetical protein OESDEN_00962 [Oesophagostomum dentatum]|uniref:Nuclear transcription factor Y subunit beta n=1 Tax=Oesophagostomum dentatum TaxID=61180 RepID=A0A0B1TP63_OESDE|nr:hypothetical protein OESDEN_00962 [Oesophagostomum dentatum]